MKRRFYNIRDITFLSNNTNISLIVYFKNICFIKKLADIEKVTLISLDITNEKKLYNFINNFNKAMMIDSFEFLRKSKELFIKEQDGVFIEIKTYKDIVFDEFKIRTL